MRSAESFLCLFYMTFAVYVFIMINVILSFLVALSILDLGFKFLIMFNCVLNFLFLIEGAGVVELVNLQIYRRSAFTV